MIWYVLVILLTALSYNTVTKLLAIQHPYTDNIIVSNMTLNLLLVVGLIGSLSPKITKRIWPKAPFWCSTLVAVLVGVVIVFVLKIMGTPTRF